MFPKRSNRALILGASVFLLIPWAALAGDPSPLQKDARELEAVFTPYRAACDKLGTTVTALTAIERLDLAHAIGKQLAVVKPKLQTQEAQEFLEMLLRAIMENYRPTQTYLDRVPDIRKLAADMEAARRAKELEESVPSQARPRSGPTKAGAAYMWARFKFDTAVAKKNPDWGLLAAVGNANKRLSQQLAELAQRLDQMQQGR